EPGFDRPTPGSARTYLERRPPRPQRHAERSRRIVEHLQPRARIEHDARTVRELDDARVARVADHLSEPSGLARDGQRARVQCRAHPRKEQQHGARGRERSAHPRHRTELAPRLAPSTPLLHLLPDALNLFFARQVLERETERSAELTHAPAP